MNPVPSYDQGQRSNTVQFTFFNPVPVISSISGTCQANLNCTPSNGFDVRINGSGFVNKGSYSGGQYFTNPTVKINGNTGPNVDILSQNQMQLYINGAYIPTPGTYTITICNAGTIQGTACSDGFLTVNP
jgi:expansin (peptidoglycan-binding protein)